MRPPPDLRPEVNALFRRPTRTDCLTIRRVRRRGMTTFTSISLGRCMTTSAIRDQPLIFGGCLSVLGDCDVGGSQSWLQPPCRRPHCSVRSLGFSTTSTISGSTAEPPRKAAAAMIGCPAHRSPPKLISTYSEPMIAPGVLKQRKIRDTTHGSGRDIRSAGACASHGRPGGSRTHKVSPLLKRLDLPFSYGPGLLVGITGFEPAPRRRREQFYRLPPQNVSD